MLPSNPFAATERPLESAPRLATGVIGDFALDIYHTLDDTNSEISVETGMRTHSVRESRFTLGGAGNVVANLAAMGCRSVRCFGVVGDDIYGRTMVGLLQELGCDVTGVIRQASEWSTQVYTKLISDGEELPRVDHGNFNVVSDSSVELLRDALRAAVSELDVLVINQQALAPLLDERMRGELCTLGRAPDSPIVLCDSRDHADEFDGAIRKLNTREASRLLGLDPSEARTTSEWLEIADRLRLRWKRPLVITDGDRGSYYSDDSGAHHLAGLLILSRVDTVGAGDSYMAALAATLGGGATLEDAVKTATLAAGVTIQKLNVAGTASVTEIATLAQRAAFRHNLELAANPGDAHYVDGTEIEIIAPPPESRDIKVAVFDHDGTISTLREGWHSVMREMMITAAGGRRLTTLPAPRRSSLEQAIDELIARTTGVQTLVQMQHLVEMVHEFGYVPKAEILDAHGYKHIYNEMLMSAVRTRRGRVERGVLDSSDYTIKGATSLLAALAARGVVLYLASGTDLADVEAEARALRYAELFGPRIFGATTSITYNPKVAALEQIAREFADVEPHQVVIFGDGPVEISLGRRQGWYSVGVASDEPRRHGICLDKRARLIEAGAHAIVPDFSEWRALVGLVLGEREHD
ncbi:MAG: HAD family hydrolase [Spirochaetaceae bacterium]|nr:MAG: HAD family hydrolase [Spirochaetaceae bacterium]